MHAIVHALLQMLLQIVLRKHRDGTAGAKSLRENIHISAALAAGGRQQHCFKPGIEGGSADRLRQSLIPYLLHGPPRLRNVPTREIVDT